MIEKVDKLPEPPAPLQDDDKKTPLEKIEEVLEDVDVDVTPDSVEIKISF